MKRLLLVLVLLLCLRGEAQMSFSYTLPYDCTNVTIGVKDSTGALIRTLSPRGAPKNAGTYNGTWDGLTDAGAAATGGPFTIVVLYGNPRYTFNGQVGNTSQNLVGWKSWNWFWSSGMPRFTFANGLGWASSGYAEGNYHFAYFTPSNPNIPTGINVSYNGNAGSAGFEYCDIASDNTYLYLAQCTSIGSTSGGWAFVTKLDATTGQPAFFTDLSVSKCTAANYPQPGCNGIFAPAAATNNSIPSPFVQYSGVAMTEIDIAKPSGATVIAPPTTLAVQFGATGILAVGHANYYASGGNIANNDIKFFDKITGLPISPVNDATVNNPTSMAFTSAGLWVVGDGVLTLVSSPGVGNGLSNPITGLSYPMGVASNPTNNHLYIIDGGTSQQVKEFDQNYNLVRTYGVLGGYTDCNPTIAHNRLLLDYTAITGINGMGNSTSTAASRNSVWAMPSIRVDSSTGDVWVTDLIGAANNYVRVQHLTPSGATFNYVNQIQKGGYVYGMTASKNAPNRIFSGFLEFNVNWDTPNTGGDPEATGSNAWQLVRDWRVGSEGACGSTNLFNSVVEGHIWMYWSEQLSGHFYLAINVGHPNPIAANNGLWVVELPQSGTSPMRVIGVNLTANSNIGADGSMRYFTNSGTGPGSTQTLNLIPFTGLDSNNNPTWGPSQVLQTVVYNQSTQPTLANATGGYVGRADNEATFSGIYPGVQVATYYSRAGGTTNYAYPHLAGILPGRATYLYTALPEGCTGYYPKNDGTYPCMGGSGNLALHTGVSGHNIVSEYCPQAAPYAAYMPQYYHFWEDGMFIGQFGGYTTNSWAPVGTNYIFQSPRISLLAPSLGWRSIAPNVVGWIENCGSARLVTSPDTGNLYMATISEAYTLLISSWKISNLSSIQELQGTGSLGQSRVITLDQLVDMKKKFIFKERREEKKEERKEERRHGKRPPV